MVGDGLDVAVDVRIEMLSALTVVDASGDHVEEMRDDAGADQELPLGIMIDPPRIAESVGDDLESFPGRVIPPDAAVDIDAVATCARDDFLGKWFLMGEESPLPLRFSHFRRGGVALQSVEPAIRPPMEAVQHFMSIADAPSGQAHFDVVNVCAIVPVP